MKSDSFDPLKDRQDLACLLELDPHALVIPKQVHSKEIEIVYSPGSIHDSDGVITQNKSLVLSIQVADCIPLFLLDKNSHIFSLIHAGWRGASMGIVELGIEKMVSLGAKEDHLVALIGPAIGPCCFEIGPEVAQLFQKNQLTKGTGDRSYLNLATTVIRKLKERGLSETNIIHIDRCTHCERDFFSYRRQGPKAGRMIALCGWV